jgi:hypothetical protein
MTTDERAGLVDRIPTAPMLLFTIFFTLGVCLIQSYVLLGVGLLLAALLWVVVVKVLRDRYSS